MEVWQVKRNELRKVLRANLSTSNLLWFMEKVNMIVEARKKWNSFVAAFNALGTETRGMSPAAASVLLVAAAEYERDNAKGYQPLQAGVPGFAIFSEDKIVNIQYDYYGCREFWDIDCNFMRAKVTEAGVAYVKNHMDVFSVL